MHILAVADANSCPLTNGISPTILSQSPLYVVDNGRRLAAAVAVHERCLIVHLPPLFLWVRVCCVERCAPRKQNRLQRFVAPHVTSLAGCRHTCLDVARALSSLWVDLHHNAARGSPRHSGRSLCSQTLVPRSCTGHRRHSGAKGRDRAQSPRRDNQKYA